MNNYSTIIFLLMFSSAMQASQNTSVNKEDEAAVRQTALDYVDGYYSSDAVRLEKAIHPDINKATPRDLSQTGRTVLAYTTYSGLIESARAKIGAVADSGRHIQIQLLNIDGDVANVKVISVNFTDYIQTVKMEGAWKIVNVLFTSGTGVPPRLKDFKPAAERTAIEHAALTYLEGITGADAGCLEVSTSSDFSKITINPIAATGKTSLRRIRYEGLIGNAFARVGKQDEIYRDNRVAILDIVDGIAVVRCDMTSGYEFVQMFQSAGQWKIFNSISKQNTSYVLADAMTVTAGDPMPDFTLPVFRGGVFTLSSAKGKNVLLIFPRGRTGNSWCAYCPYQYLELEMLEKSSILKSKYNLEIAFVLPYASEQINDWMDKIPEDLEIVEGLKNPLQPPVPGSIQAEYSAWVKKNFPIKFDVKKGDSHTVIPVLIDENRTLSRRVKIFTNFWDGVSSPQNMASVFIIDKDGILRFKYIGQMTEDRPSVKFLLDFIKSMKEERK